MNGPIAVIGVDVGARTIGTRTVGTRVSITAIESYGLYPGSTVYVHINGRRWSGEEFVAVGAELFQAMLSGGQMDVSWSPWPSGGRRSRSVDLSGFSDASACLARLIDPAE